MLNRGITHCTINRFIQTRRFNYIAIIYRLYNALLAFSEAVFYCPMLIMSCSNCSGLTEPALVRTR